MSVYTALWDTIKTVVTIVVDSGSRYVGTDVFAAALRLHDVVERDGCQDSGSGPKSTEFSPLVARNGGNPPFSPEKVRRQSLSLRQFPCVRSIAGNGSGLAPVLEKTTDPHRNFSL